jgi:hypothetical protein
MPILATPVWVAIVVTVLEELGFTFSPAEAVVFEVPSPEVEVSLCELPSLKLSLLDVELSNKIPPRANEPCKYS